MPPTVCALRRRLVNSGRAPKGALGDDRDHPLVDAVRVEADEQDPLPPAQAQHAVREWDLLGARTEEERDQTLALADLERHEPLEHALEVREETRLAFLHADDARIAVRRDEGDAAAAAGSNLVTYLVRDVEHGQARKSRGDRDRDLDRGRHADATSRGSRKCTSSRATVISTTSP